MRSLLLLAVLLTGCVHTQPAPLRSSEGRSAVNARAEGRAAFVAIDGRHARPARDLHVAPDVTTWFDEKSGELRSAPTERVTAVTFRRHGAGALRGLAVGAAVGLTAGALASLAETNDQSVFAPYSYSLPQYLGLFGGSGAEIGALIGYARGERDVWRAGPAYGIAAPDSARFSVRYGQ